jgi:hypothetical protein
MLLSIDFQDILVGAIRGLRDGDLLGSDLNILHNAFKIIAALGVLVFITKRFFEDQSTGRVFDLSRYTKPFLVLIMLIMYRPMMSVINGFFDTMTNVTYHQDAQLVMSAINIANTSFFGGTSAMGALQGMMNSVLGLGGSNSNGNGFDSDIEGTDAEIDKMKQIIQMAQDNQNGQDVLANNEILQGSDQKSVKDASQTGLLTNLATTLGETINPLTKITAYVMLILMFACGPIALGLSVWPGFESSLTNFFGSYIKVALWPAIANLVAFLVFKIMTAPTVLATMAANNFFSNGGDTKLSTLFFSSIFITHMMVPRIAAALVNAGNFHTIDKGSSENSRTQRLASGQGV